MNDEGRAPTVAAPGLDRLREALASRSLLLERELGHGGMSTVYLARDTRHARLLAVKVLRPDVLGGAERFLREIEVVSSLVHPNIMPLYESGSVDGAPYYMMPYIEGESLRHRLRRVKRLDVPVAMQLAREIGDALAFAHARGVIHRDIKPENILLQAGHALVTDFGVALASRRPAPGDSGGRKLTEPGRVLGTVEYMSPEQASGDAAVDGRSDLYSLACVLYEMLAGMPPFVGHTPTETLARRFQGPPAPLTSLRPEAGAALEALVERSLAPDPADRYQSAPEWLEALREARRKSIRAGGRRSLATRWALGVALLVGAGVSLHGDWGSPALDRRRVVIARMSNETGDSSLGYVGGLLADRLAALLAGEPGIRVATSVVVVPSRVNRGLVVDSLDDPARLGMLAREASAGTVVSGSYFREAAGLSFQAEVTDANSGTMFSAIGPITVTRAALEDGVDSLDRAIAAVVKEHAHRTAASRPS
jgi:serine/threonine-protein kinase